MRKESNTGIALQSGSGGGTNVKSAVDITGAIH